MADFFDRLNHIASVSNDLDFVQTQINAIRAMHPENNRVQDRLDQKQIAVNERRIELNQELRELHLIAIFN
jgi:hypothetical protein